MKIEVLSFIDEQIEYVKKEKDSIAKRVILAYLQGLREGFENEKSSNVV